MKELPAFAELNAKSCFSFLYGASHPEEMVARAHELGYRAMALTDHQGFYGMVRAYDKARELSLPLVVGVEVKVENAALVFLAKNFNGYKRLCRMLSESMEDLPKGEAQLTRSHLSNWLCSETIHTLLPPRQFPSASLFSFLRKLTPFTQLATRTLHPDHDQALKKWLAELPKDIPIAWSWDPVFHEPSRYELFEVMGAIRDNIPLKERLPSPNEERYLKPLSFLSSYRVPKEWLHRSVEIAESCTFSPSEIHYRYPKEWLPPGKSSFEFLKELCHEGLGRRFPSGAGPDIAKQLSHELNLVEELQFEDYFLTVWDIVQFARSQNILCQGRGSAANSLICYLLGVTSIDPIQMNLLFERFLTRERNEAPDIDVDFEHERREEVIQYIYQKYGRHRAGMVATLITYRTRSALRDIGKAIGVPLSTIETFSQRTHWKENVFKDTPSPDPLIARWLKLGRELKGFPRHLGQHTGGMILTADRLDEISPIEPARMAGRSVVQWDKYDIEKLGLLKIDVLSLGMLTCLRKSFDLLEKYAGVSLSLHTIPPDDPRTYEMIAKALTVGVFQIESRAQMAMLPKLRPRNFYDIVVEVAIVRPGPIQGGMVHPYLRRRLGLEKVTYAHPKLKPILEKTFGIPIFQEQVMKMAIDIAGYTPGEADALRRAMGSWKKTGNLEAHAQRMSARMISEGVPEAFAQQVCAQILGFGEYGFPESHAASFALLTYASSYLKAHYPDIFLCALLNSLPMGFYSIHMLTNVYRREGVHILPVHTELSDWDHRIEKTNDGRAIRLGFRVVPHLQKEHAELFIEKRKLGELDLYAFNRDERAALAMAAEQENRRAAYWKALNPHKDHLPMPADPEVSFPKIDAVSSFLLDLEFTQTNLGVHPAILLKQNSWSYDLPPERLHLSDQLGTLRNSQTVHVFGVTHIVQQPPTAKGMFFMTLEDEKGFLNLVFRPDIYKSFKDIIQQEWGMLISGKLQHQSGAISILVQHVHRPAKRPGRIISLEKKGFSAVPTSATYALGNM